MIIYKTTNLINGKFYIGQDSKNNRDYLGSGSILQNAIKKYGKDSFIKETIEECASKEKLNEREIYWIDKLNATNRSIAYNILEGGLGGDTITNHPDREAICRRNSEGQKGRVPWNVGLSDIYSDETIAKMSKSRSKLIGDKSSRYIDINEIELEKILKDKTIKETAKHFDVSISCIRRKISDYNLVITKKSGNFEKSLPEITLNKIYQLRNEGNSIEEIAKIVNIGIHKTRKILKNKYGIIKRIR